MSDITVYNCSPSICGYMHGTELVRLFIGENTVKREGLIAALHKPKSAQKVLLDQGLLRLDGFYPSTVARPKKIAAVGPDIVIEDPNRPTPTPKLRPLYSTQAPCPRMLALYNEFKPGARKPEPKAPFKQPLAQPEPKARAEQFKEIMIDHVSPTAHHTEITPLAEIAPSAQPSHKGKGKKQRKG